MSGNQAVYNLINHVRPVLDRLTSHGYEAFLVGGALRDCLLYGGPNRQVDIHDRPMGAAEGQREAEPFDWSDTDIDVATNAMPEQVMEVFGDWNVIPTGIKHGTVTVIEHGRMAPDNMADKPARGKGKDRLRAEITTFRSDGDYSDNRHPDSVAFVSSIEEDLSRRDFTVNAIAADIEGRLIDPFGGEKDLREGIIRAVGDPIKRFDEDGLRILRALRFASVLDFEIEGETAKAIHACKDLLDNIASERVFSELKKMIAGDGAGRIIREYVDVIEVVIPELGPAKGMDQRNPYHRYDVLEHCIRAMENVETDQKNREYLKLMALLHDIGKPSTFSMDDEGIGHFYGHAEVGEKICRRIMDRLKADGFTKERICTLVRHHDLVFQEDDRLLKRWMNRYSPEVLLELLAFKRADNIATGNAGEDLLEKFSRIRERIYEIIGSESCFILGDLAVNGDDLIDEGIGPGPEVGMVLNSLLESVIDGKLPNEKDVLLEEVGRLKNTDL